MPIQESGEMYLETILILSKKKATVRAIDICDYMNYSKPSVSRALGLLKSGGYVTTDKDGFITLTEVGLETATKILSRHRIITEFLIKLGVDSETASNDACKIEHVISDVSLKAIENSLK